jgi:hypothetical protein
MVYDPAWCADPSPKDHGINATAFSVQKRLGTMDGLNFGASPTAHSLTYLRIVRSVSRAAARLASDPLGSALAGQDSHLQGDDTGFLEVTTSSVPPVQT